MSLKALRYGASAIVMFGLASGLPQIAPAFAQTAQAGGAVDVDRMLGFLPADILARYAETSFDEATGRTTVTGLRLTSSDNEDIGIVIDTLTVAGFDAGRLEARLAGSDLNETGMLVDYLEARNVSFFGTEALSNIILEAVEELDESEAATDSVEKLDFQIDRVLIDDLMLRPFLYAPRDTSGDEDADFAEFLNLMQVIAAYSGAIGASEMSMDGVTFEMDFVSEGQAMSLSYDISRFLVQDWQGGDVGLSMTEPVSFNMTVPVPPEDQDENLPFDELTMAGTAGRQTVRGIKLDKLYGWLAKGEMPPTSETDLLSLGVWESGPQSLSMFGAPFYSVGSSSADLSNFHWLVPTDVSMRIDDVVYDFRSFISAFEEADAGIDDEELQQITQFFEVAETYDLAAPSMDFALNWLWDPNAGPGEMAIRYGIDDFATLTTNLSGELSDFAGYVELFESNLDEDAVEAFLNATTRFSGFSMALEDQGGLDKIFALAIDIAKLQPEGSEAAALANFTPETLRNLAVAGTGLAAAPLAEDFPPILEYSNAFAGFLNLGGVFSVMVAPDEPLSVKAMRKLSDILETPDELVDLLGLSVTHDAPATE